MKKTLTLLAGTTLCVAMAFPVLAKTINPWKIDGIYRIQLEVLPLEPFVKTPPTQSGQVQSGMVAIRGAAPAKLNTTPQPNHHLIVHVLNRKTGQVITHASVQLSLRRLNAHHQPTGPVLHIPVVEMQAAGQGPASTHYGNNVFMTHGNYQVTVGINGKITHFQIKE